MVREKGVSRTSAGALTIVSEKRLEFCSKQVLLS